jgi:hypothetical protein
LDNLQLVILSPDKIGAPLTVQKISNFCSDKCSASCDSFFVADVMAFHLTLKSEHSSGLLSGFSKINQCGDHGPHFVSRQTVLNESRFHELYGIELENHFLCSYHAYNRCDGAGVESKRLAVQAMKARRGWRGSWVRRSDQQVRLHRPRCLPLRPNQPQRRPVPRCEGAGESEPSQAHVWNPVSPRSVPDCDLAATTSSVIIVIIFILIFIIFIFFLNLILARAGAG